MPSPKADRSTDTEVCLPCVRSSFGFRDGRPARPGRSDHDCASASQHTQRSCPVCSAMLTEDRGMSVRLVKIIALWLFPSSGRLQIRRPPQPGQCQRGLKADVSSDRCTTDSLPCLLYTSDAADE